MMAVRSHAEELALAWIDLWNKGEPDQIPLTEDFVHTSPYGRVEGRKTYLEWVKPLARQNVTSLNVLRTIGGSDQAVVHFEMHTPAGTIQVCDWITVEGDQIAEIHSFYDATELRK